MEEYKLFTEANNINLGGFRTYEDAFDFAEQDSIDYEIMDYRIEKWEMVIWCRQLMS